MSRKYLVIRGVIPFSGRTNVFPCHSDFTDVEPLYEFKFFSKKFWRAARAREITSPRKTSIFFECCKKWPQQKNFFAEMWEMAKKNIWTDKIFVKYF